MKIAVILVLGMFCQKTFGQNNSELFLLVNDFVEFFEHPNKMFTHVCYQKDSQINFQRNLQGTGLQSNFDEVNLYNSDVLGGLSFIFLDMSCPESKNILEQAENLQVFTPSHRWLLLLNSPIDTLSGNFPINSNIFTFEPNYYGYSIKNIYRPSQNSTKLVENFIGYWIRDGGYFKVYDTYEERQKRQLWGEKLKISYVLEDMDSALHLEDYQYNILTDTLTKFNYALIQDLIYLINASKTEIFRQYYDSERVENETCIGMIDDLNQDSEIGGTPIKFLSDRVDQFDLLAKTTKLEKKFVFRATPHSYISNVFTLPFDSYVWYSCFGLMATIFFVAYLVVYWERKDPIFRTYLSPKLCLRPHPVDIFLMEVGSAAQQGFESEPRSNSGRIVFIFTLISLMFLYTSFSANIVALLQSTTESVNSLENLLDSRIPVGFEENISMRYFEDLNYEKKSREFYNKIQKPQFLSVGRGVKKVQEEFFAFYGDTSKIYKYVNDWFFESEKCGLREIPFKNTHVDYWLIIKKNSTYKDILRAGMCKIHETGLRSREHRRFFTTKPDCDSAGGNFESVGLADSYGAFLVMAAGIAISFVLFLIENVWRKYYVQSNARLLENNENLDFIGDVADKYTSEENALENEATDIPDLTEYKFTV